MADNEPRINETAEGLDVSGVRLDKEVVTKAADFVTSHAGGNWGMGADTGDRLAPTHDEIAQLAFSLYEARGRQDGHDIEDWQRAEQELLRLQA